MFPFYIAKRYLFSKSSQNAINIINAVTTIVVVVGSAALLIVLAGFAGLKTFSLSFSNTFDPDLKITPKIGKTLILNNEKIAAINQLEDIASFTKTVEERVFLNFKDKNYITHIKGVDTNYLNTSKIDSLIFIGNWFSNKNEVVIGSGVSRKLSLGVFDSSHLLEIIVPKAGKGSVSFSSESYNNTFTMVSGIYNITEDLDKKYVFADVSLAQELLNYNVDEISSIEIKLNDDAQEEALVKQLSAIFNDEVIIKNRIQLNDTLYKMLNTENIAVYLIFTLVLIIALFNLVGAIIMMILDKKKNLKTLFSLGASVKELKRIFFLQGILVSVFGGLVGIFIGIAIVWAQTSFGLIMITPTLPYPMELRLVDVLVVFATILVLGTIASKIASSRISKNLVA